MDTPGAGPGMDLARQRLLEADSLHLPMRERLERALKRARASAGGIELIHVQSDVLSDAVEYLEDVLEREEDALPMARIILPPRTGKTVIAAKLVELTGLTAVFCVPSLALLDQVRREFERRLPGVPVGTYSGARKEVVTNGVNITTYQLLQRQASAEVPSEIRASALIFPDEAHRAMTELRSGVLRKAFDPLAVRIALTGTPDYSEERALVKYFPDLIHEITLEEGVELGLLARVKSVPVRVRYEAEPLHVVAGDYEQGELGQAMSHVAMLQGVHQVRYAEEYRQLPTLIACASIAQAMCVFEHLAGSHPEGTPCPAPIHSDVEPGARNAFIQMFRDGILDTLIVVGMLLEGFDMPNCRLLIDLSPSCSLVRTKQKYTRVMTKVGNEVGHIVSLLPTDLPRHPYLPRDIFGPSVEEAVEADERTPKNGNGQPRRRPLWERLQDAGIEAGPIEISLDRLSGVSTPHPLRLNRYDRPAVRRIVRRSGFRLDKVAWRQKSAFFRWKFEVEERLVSGAEFLQALGLSGNMNGLRRFVDDYYPSLGADRRLFCRNTLKQVEEPPEILGEWPPKKAEEQIPIILTRAEIRLSSVDELLMGPAPPSHPEPWRMRDFSHGMLAVGMRERMTPFDQINVNFWEEEVLRLLNTLTPMEARILRWRFGLGGEDELTLRAIGDKYNLSPERIRGLQNEALSKVRKQIRGYSEDEFQLSAALSSLPKTQEELLEGLRPEEGMGLPSENKRWVSRWLGSWKEFENLTGDELEQAINRCLPPSPSWRRYILPHPARVMSWFSEYVTCFRSRGWLTWRLERSMQLQGDAPKRLIKVLTRYGIGTSVYRAPFVDFSACWFVRLGFVQKYESDAFLVSRFVYLW